MLTEALEYPRNHDDWVKTVIIGGLLALFTPLIIPAIFLAGYVVRVLRGSMNGEETPPVFDDWGELFSEGLGAAVIGIVYGLLPAIVIVATAVLGGAIALGGGDVAAGAGSLIFLVGVLVAFVLAIMMGYVVPAAVATYVQTGRIGSGFSWSALRPVLLNGTYANAWLVGFAIILGASVISGILNFIPLLGLLVGGFLGFYAAVAAYHVIGRAWAEMHPVDPEAMERPDTSPVV
jgi:hypothetical protein